MRSFLCMRRAQQCRARRQSAAILPSHAPHGSKARLREVATCRGSWRSHVHRTHTAQRVQPFKNKTRNVGGRGDLPSSFSGGSKGGILFEKRIPPLTPSRTVRESPPAPVQEKDFYASGVKTPFSVTSIVQRISCSSTGTSGDRSCSRQISTVGQWSCGSRRS